jgi:hypothetical protein
MGKRSNLSVAGANPKDFWATPAAAVEPLLAHLGDAPIKFVEPCAGDGALVRALTERGHTCLLASDLEPRAEGIEKADALDVKRAGNAVITNPPYTRKLVYPLIRHWLSEPGDTWLLIPSDWLFNLWFAPFAPHVHEIVPVGRVKWIAGSPSMGMENSTWIRLNAVQKNFIAARKRMY